MSKRRQSHAQKQMRKRRSERAFLFDQDLARLLGEVDRGEWEFAVALTGGDIAAAAEIVGLDGIPRSARVLWGRSAQGALETYRAWQNRKNKARGKPGRR